MDIPKRAREIREGPETTAETLVDLRVIRAMRVTRAARARRASPRVPALGRDPSGRLGGLGDYRGPQP